MRYPVPYMITEHPFLQATAAGTKDCCTYKGGWGQDKTCPYTPDSPPRVCESLGKLQQLCSRAYNAHTAFQAGCPSLSLAQYFG